MGEAVTETRGEDGAASITTVSNYTAEYWHERLKTYHDKIESKWADQRKNIDRLYSRDERADTADREYAIFWANIEVLKPAIYARPPQPVVGPRFKDGNKVASAASEILQRCLTTTFEQSDLDGCMRDVRDELLRYSRGIARARLSERSGSPCVEFDQFTASDFAHDPARSWREVTWVGFRAWMTREKGIRRFGDKFEDVPLKKRNENAAVNDPDDQAAVWEIWCKDSGKVHFIAEDFDDVLDEQEPWLTLTNFWPCPKPVYGTTVPGIMKPVPDIIQYKDQIEEINEYTARISALSQSLRLKGFYPAGEGEISEAIEAAIKDVDNRSTLIPVSSFASLGGSSFKESIVWLPFDQVLNLIRGLVELRRVVIEDVYQITGISDIVRGQSQASETATAQQIKSQWGSFRVRERQNEMVRFARDLTRLAGEIIAENFDGQTIKQMAQVQLPSVDQKLAMQMKVQQEVQAYQQLAQQAQVMNQAPPPPPQIPPQIKQAMEGPAFEDVLQFLANDKARGFVIDIETDSTIQPDEDAEKQRRTEFVTAVGGFMQQAFPIVQAVPQFAHFVGETMKFVSQGFRAGRSLEGAIDQLVQQIELMAQQPKSPPQPDPSKLIEQQTAKIRGEAEVMKANSDMAQAQMSMRKASIEHHLDMQRLAAQSMVPAAAMPQGF